MSEVWKDIKGYEGLYQINGLGNVKSLCRVDLRGHKRPERTLKPAINSMGYLSVGLHKDKKLKSHNIHVLLAMSFLNHKPNGHVLVVDHKDHNKLNNSLDNLQIITHRENVTKDLKGGTSKFSGVDWHKLAKKWRSRIIINGKQKHLGLFVSETEASEVYQKELIKIVNR